MMTPRPASRSRSLARAHGRVAHGLRLLVCVLLSAIGATSAGCASTVKQAAKEAAPAAVESAAEEAKDPETRDNVARLLTDPEILEATASLSEAIAGGAVAGLSDAERAAQLRRLTDQLVATVGAAIGRSLRDDIGPQLSATFADAVDRSLAAALDEGTEQRMSAMALAVTRGAMQGVGELLIDPTTGRASPFSSHLLGQLAREMARQSAFGFDEAIREAAEEGRVGERGVPLDGGVLAAAGSMSAWVLALPPLIIGGLVLLTLTGSVALGLALWRLQHHRQMSRGHEEAALALARAIKATESAAWSDELRTHIARATRDDAGGAQLRKLLRDHAELRLNSRDVPPRSERARCVG